MITVNSCVLDDNKRRVCLEDLKQYWKKTDYLEGLTDVEKFRIKQNLGIIDKDLEIDNHLDKHSKFPVQNRVLAIILEKKLDIDSAAKVALTGQYNDLKNTPCALPNPEGLLVNTVNGQFYYDGSEQVEIPIPTKVSEFQNDANYITEEHFEEVIPMKSVSVNGIPQHIGATKNLDIKVPSKVSQLSDADQYLKVNDVTDVLRENSLDPISSGSMARVINQLTERISVLEAKIKRLEK